MNGFGAWIYMNDCQPETDGRYLCICNKRVEIWQRAGGHFRLYGDNKDSWITAWMPLPDLPEEMRKE